MPNPAAGITAFLILPIINKFIFLSFTCQLTFGKIDFMATTPISFLRETRDELKKVVWPSRAEVIRLTIVVILVSAIVGFYIGGIDFILTKVMSAVIK